MFWRHNYFLLKIKNSQENICKESYFKKCLFKNVMSETARDLQAFLVFSQHPARVITPVNP